MMFAMFAVLLNAALIVTLFTNISLCLNQTCDPLILTPYIASHNIEEARRLSAVESLPNAPKLKSYTGFLTVNKQYNSNLFFWFFPAMNNSSTAPLLLWLQGGPGASSLFGLFVENGPYIVDKDLNISFNPYSWSLEFSMLYIDNPVGTGFSFTDDKQGFSRDEHSVADNLYEALQQFFTIFSEYRKNEFYITGESYAGKYIPAIGNKLHSKLNESNINFIGVAIGNGWIDGIDMIDMGSYLYEIGLIDERQTQHFYEVQNMVSKYVENEDYLNATRVYDQLIGDDKSYFENVTGLSFYLNYLLTKAPPDFEYFSYYLNLTETREALHVSCVPFSDDSDTVYEYLADDEFKTAKPWFITLINNYKVLLYSGLLDIIVATPLTVNFLNKLEWKYSKEFAESERLIWKVSNNDTEVSGYVKCVANFTFVTLRNAGHIVPYDQPRAAKDMINNFIYSQKFNAIN